jgi:prophage DNA circulation protein
MQEYPGRDRAWPEDMGLKTREFSVQAYVLGAAYMTARDALIDACAKAGSGLLIHPWLGRVTVVCTGCQLSESVDEGGVARLNLSFVDAGENTFPSSVNDTAGIVDLRATDALAAAKTSFRETFTVSRLPGFVSEAAVNIAEDAATVINAVAGGRVTAPFATGLHDFRSSIASLIQEPGTFATRLTDLTKSAIAEAGTGQSAMSALSTIAHFGNTFPTIPQTTGTRIRQAVNQSALTALVRRSASVEMARLAPAMDYDFAEAAFEQRDHIGDLLDREMEEASSSNDDAVFVVFRRLRAAVVKDLNGRAPALASLVQVNARKTEPALVTAYRLYGDAIQSDTLAARNRLRHPGFVPGGSSLEVLSRSGGINV